MSVLTLLFAVALAFLGSPGVFVSSFSPRSPSQSQSSSQSKPVPSLVSTAKATATSDGDSDGDSPGIWSRKDLLDSTKAGVASLAFAGCTMPLLWLVPTEAAQAANANANAKAKPAAAKIRGGPVAIVGASGRTGSLCVDACLRRGIPVRALTRTGDFVPPPTPEGAVTFVDADAPASPLLLTAKCDIASSDATVENLAEAFEGCSAVIYAASASKKGGSAHDIDNVGLVRTAEACVAASVNRCVVISSTATTRPKSLGYVFTNLGVGGNIMGEKRNGELGTMAAYQNQSNQSSQSNSNAKLSYTIIRPGGLEEPKRNKVLGPSVLEVSQGDVFSGIVSRADIAELTVELALSDSPNVRNTAVEVYYTDSVVEVEKGFKKLLAAAKLEGSPEQKQLRLHGSTYSDLLENVRPGVDFAAE